MDNFQAGKFITRLKNSISIYHVTRVCTRLNINQLEESFNSIYEDMFDNVKSKLYFSPSYISLFLRIRIFDTFYQFCFCNIHCINIPF